MSITEIYEPIQNDGFASLNILINLILQTYFTNSRCLHAMTEETYNQLAISHFPTILESKKDHQTTLDANKYCRDFLLIYEDATIPMDHIENEIEQTSIGGAYTERRYIVILFNSKNMNSLFDLNSIRYIRDVLVIDWENDTSNKACMHQFGLYTHNYNVTRDIYSPKLLDIWFGCNETFKFSNKLLPNDISDQKGRTLFGHMSDEELRKIQIDNSVMESDFQILKLFLKRYNLKYNYSDTVIDVQCNLYLRINASYKYDIMRSAFIDVTAMVPLPRKLQSWHTLFYTFNAQTWLSFFAAYSCLFLLAYYHKNDINNLHAFFGLMVNQAMKLTNISTHQLRYLLGLTFFASFMFTALFSSRLLSTLMVPTYENDIQTVDELSNSGMLIVAEYPFFTDTKKDNRTRQRQLHANTIIIKNKEEIREKIYELKHSFLCYLYESGYIEVANFPMEDPILGDYKLLTDNIARMKACMTVKKNFYMSPLLLDMVYHAREAGLTIKWEDQLFQLRNNYLAQMRLKDATNKEGPIILKIAHVKGVFAFWIIGLIVAVCVFFIEVLYRKVKNKSAKRLPKVFIN